MPGVKHEDTMRSIKLFNDEVIPKINLDSSNIENRRMILDSKKPLKLKRGLILNTRNGKTPKKIENILRHGKPL